MRSSSAERAPVLDAAPPSETAAPAHEPSGRRAARRLARRIALWAIAGLVVLAGLSLIPVLFMRGDLERGKAELTSAEQLLVAGDLERAVAAFDRAGAAFREASSAPGAFLLELDGLIPYVGRTPKALVDLTHIARDVSAAGGAAAQEVARLPGGLSALGPRHGSLPIETLSSLAPAMHRARVALEQAAEDAARLPSSWVLGPVAAGRDLVRQKLDQAVPLARAADALMRQLPAFAGADGPVRYFVAPQNLSEARGTGGLIGNYAILTIDHGRFSFGPFSSVEDLPNLTPTQAPAANPLYDAFGGGGFWLNVNMTPDAPTAATMIESLYERTRGVRLDGTLFVDLDAMARMLEVTGPVRVEALHATITSDNVVQFVANTGYRNLPWNYGGLGRQTLGPRLVAQALLGRFFASPDSEQALRALVGAAADGHILIHSAHPEVQAALREAGVSGAFGTTGGDFVGVIASNGAANKVDYYVKRSIRYEVSLGPDGTATATATATFQNQAPAGKPGYALGPNGGTGLEPGEDQLWTSFYCPAECRQVAATENGGPATFPHYQDLGLSMYAAFIRVKPQQSDDVSLRWTLPAAWTGDVGSGVYRVRVQSQPTVDPIEATVVIHAPAGMRISWTSVPMRVEGGIATWTGVLRPYQDLEVRFRKPALLAAWSRFVRFLSTPAVRL